MSFLSSRFPYSKKAVIFLKGVLSSLNRSTSYTSSSDSFSEPLKDFYNCDSDKFCRRDMIGTFTKVNLNSYPIFQEILDDNSNSVNVIKIHSSGIINFQNCLGEWKNMGKINDICSVQTKITPSYDLHLEFQNKGLLLNFLELQVIQTTSMKGLWISYEYSINAQPSYRDELFERQTEVIL